MIKTENLTKQFDTTTALDCLSTTIEEGRIYGLVGSNGAGKSTLLRLLAGVYRPTSGSVEIDGEPVFENSALKQKIFFIPDELYQMPGASLASLANIYRALYHSWSDERYQELVGRFPIPPERKLSACSKGMRRQIAIILALSSQPKYLLLDEAFDGLDPVIRVAVRKLIADDILQRGTTVLIASHNLRELEDMCDEVGLLHGGKILFQRELSELRSGFAKVQLIARPLLEFYGYMQQFGEFENYYHEYGAWIVFGAGLTPFPYKIVTIASGVVRLDMVVFTIASIIARGMRFYFIAWLLKRYGDPMKVFIEKNLNLLSVLFMLLLIGGFAAIKLL